MKKLLTLLVVFLMALTLTGCGSKKEEVKEQTDLEYVTSKGTLVVGITDFAPMDYTDSNGEWIGFDADMAKGFAKELGVEVEFIEIDWDNKIMELNSKSIDCIWNGMTLTSEVMSATSTSNAYCDNAQIIVTKAENAGKYANGESLKGANVAVEAGSAAAEVLDDLGVEYLECGTQAAALMEVAAGTSDVCVIDALMAGAMIGEGTAYEDLTTTAGLNSEQYGVAFRQGSDLANALNDYFAKSYADGSMMTVAETYGVQVSIIAQ